MVESNAALDNRVLVKIDNAIPKVKCVNLPDLLVLGREIYCITASSLARLKVNLAEHGGKLVVIKRFKRLFDRLVANT